jgi:hypothetical protein
VPVAFAFLIDDHRGATTIRSTRPFEYKLGHITVFLPSMVVIDTDRHRPTGTLRGGVGRIDWEFLLFFGIIFIIAVIKRKLCRCRR